VSSVMVVNRLGATALLDIALLFHNDLRSTLETIAMLLVLYLFLQVGLPNLPERHAIATMMPGSWSVKGKKTQYNVLTMAAFVVAICMCLWSLTEDMVYSMSSVLSEQASISPELSGTLLAGKVFGGLVGALLAPVALHLFG